MENDSKKEEKPNLRNTMKALRVHANQGDLERAGAQISQNIIEWDVYQHCTHLLAYYPANHEADIRPVLKHGLDQGKIVALPKVTGKRTMDFYPVSSLSCLVRGAMGLMEPGPGLWPLDLSCRALKAQAKILMLVPGLAFSRSKKAGGIGRLGYGGGFYDTWLGRFFEAPLQIFNAQDDFVTCGVAYQFQVIPEEKLPMDGHDHYLNYLATQATIQ